MTTQTSSCKTCKDAAKTQNPTQIICKKYGWIITVELAETQQVCKE